jgi:hypothetical protein
MFPFSECPGYSCDLKEVEVNVECMERERERERGAAYLIRVKLIKKTFPGLKVLRQFPLVPLV